MKLPMDYEKTQAFDGEGRPKLLSGGFVCQIQDCKEVKTQDGRPMLELYLDIFEGSYRNYFGEQYSAAIRYGNSNPKWRCIYRQPLIKKDQTTNPRFKGMITAIQDSNPNAMIINQGNLNPDALKTCVVGVLFREEHSVWNGREIIKGVPERLIDVKKIRSGEYTVPAPKLLTEEDKDKLRVAQGFTEDASSELPF